MVRVLLLCILLSLPCSASSWKGLVPYPSSAQLPHIWKQYLRGAIALGGLCLNSFDSVLPARAITTNPEETVMIDESEVDKIVTLAKRAESSGDFAMAQKYYEQIVDVQPDSLVGWASLGNVLTTEGNLKDALLCYRKALTLHPAKKDEGLLLLNKAMVEMALQENQQALADLTYAEKLSGSTTIVLTNKAVLLSRLGEWKEASDLFEKVVSAADRNPLPWWLRFTMSLAETSRPTEAVAYLQRVLNRYPDEAECLAYATALYSMLGDFPDALHYWKSLNNDEQKKYLDEQFLRDQVIWGPNAIAAMKQFATRLTQ